MRGLFASLLVAMTLAGAKASAGEFIAIENGTDATPVRVTGYLTRPPGTGPFAAVVLLHGRGGFHSSMMSWADRLSRMGYVALAVDSFGSRQDPALAPGGGIQAYGHRVEYNEDAHRESVVRVPGFLQRTIGAP